MTAWQVRTQSTIGQFRVLLRGLYETSGLSQKQCAARLGVDERAFAYWLSGERRFPYTAQFAMEQLAKRKPR